jgi:nitrate reductase NapD
MPKNEVHISSFVVYCAAHGVTTVAKVIEEEPSTEIYAISDEGKIVVVMETSNQGFITETIDKINALPEVINTALVYHQIDDHPETLDNDIHATETSDATTAVCNDPSGH